ncbi:hypothetical protein [Microbulbifer sp. TRSA005]|uniref:hypothetical protein n=1 Tax=Microbulbifer sp. TRSA005 TaxID=3243383 RepID=UPI00403960AA
MRFVDRKDVKPDSFGGLGRGALDVFIYFEERQFSEITKEATAGDRITSPSVFGGDSDYCNQSCFICPHNFLYFKSGAAGFWVIQHLVFCDSIYIPAFDLVVCGNSSKSKAKKIFESSLMNLSIGDKGCFNGILNGYRRPYHYFYDKLFPTLSLIHELEEVKYRNISGSFIELDEVSTSFVRCEQAEESGFYLMPSKSLYTRSPRSFFETLKYSLVKSRTDGEGELSRFDRVFWFGLSLEKRKFIERETVICGVIDYLSCKYKNPLFVFDGLTRVPSEGREKFVASKCSSELSCFNSIVSNFPESNVLNLIGATAKEKVVVASSVDFYFSSYLTDSIWCSAIGACPGIAYRPKLAFGRGSFLHPLTHEVPKKMVSDVGEISTDDWDRQDISIDSSYLISALKNSIDLTLTLNDWLSSLKKTVENGAGTYESPLFDVPFISNKKLSFRLDDYSKNIKSLILRLKDCKGVAVLDREVKGSFSVDVPENVGFLDMKLLINRSSNWRPKVSASMML